MNSYHIAQAVEIETLRRTKTNCSLRSILLSSTSLFTVGMDNSCYRKYQSRIGRVAGTSMLWSLRKTAVRALKRELLMCRWLKRQFFHLSSNAHLFDGIPSGVCVVLNDWLSDWRLTIRIVVLFCNRRWFIMTSENSQREVGSGKNCENWILRM